MTAVCGARPSTSCGPSRSLLERIAARTGIERWIVPHHSSSYWWAGRTGEAIAILEQVAADSEQLRGPNHPDTLTARSGITMRRQKASRNLRKTDRGTKERSVAIASRVAWRERLPSIDLSPEPSAAQGDRKRIPYRYPRVPGLVHPQQPARRRLMPQAFAALNTSPEPAPTKGKRRARGAWQISAPPVHVEQLAKAHGGTHCPPSI